MMMRKRSSEFDEWYRDSYPRVLAAVQVVCGDTAFAEDATHTAYVRALERWSTVRQMESPTGWVVRVGVNVAKRSFLRRIKGASVERQTSGSDTWTDQYTDHDLWEQVQRLSKQQRLAIALRYIEDLSQAEVATILGTAPGTAGATLNQARSSLRSAAATRREGT